VPGNHQTLAGDKDRIRLLMKDEAKSEPSEQCGRGFSQSCQALKVKAIGDARAVGVTYRPPSFGPEDLGGSEYDEHHYTPDPEPSKISCSHRHVRDVKTFLRQQL